MSKDLNSYVKKRSGRPRKTPQRQDKEILRSVSTQKKSIREITKTSTFPNSRSTIHRRIQSSKFQRYRRMLRTPMLKLYHRKARVFWTKKDMHWTDQWLNVFFSDEKKLIYITLMAGNTTSMNYDENLLSSLVDIKEGILSWCGARSASTEQPILLFLIVDRPLKIIKMPSKQSAFNWKYPRKEKLEIPTG